MYEAEVDCCAARIEDDADSVDTEPLQLRSELGQGLDCCEPS